MPLHLKAREIDITDANHVSTLITEIERSENQERKKKSWENFQVEAGNIKDFVIKKLKANYPETWMKFRVGDVSLSKKMVRKLAKAYKKPPIRELEGDDSNTDQIELERVYKRDKFDRVYKEFDKIFNLHKYACFWAPWVNPTDEEPEGHFSPQALAPYEYDLVRDEITGEALIFILSFPDRIVTGDTSFTDGIDSTITEHQGDQGAQKKHYSLWSAKSHSQVVATLSPATKETRQKVEVKFLKIPGNELMKNPIGMLPIAFESQDLSVDYPVPSNMGDQSVEWGASLSDLKTASSAQGFGQLAIKHPEGQTFKKIHMGMHTAIDLPQKKGADSAETDAKYINASPDLDGQLNVLKFDALAIMDEHGIKAKGTISGGVDDFSSGLDRVLSQADTQDIVEDNQSIYTCTEQKVYQIVKATKDALGKQKLKADVLIVKYEKPKVLITDKETLENIEKRDELNTIFEWEKLVMIDPNMTETQAREKLIEIKKEKRENAKEIASMFDEDDQNTGHLDDDDDKNTGHLDDDKKG